MTERKLSKGIIILIACIVLLAVCVALLFVFWGRNNETSEYDRMIELAEDYLAQGNLEMAELTFLNAIDLDENNITAYVRLADLYQSESNFTEMQNVLMRGINATGNQSLQNRLDMIRSFLSVSDTISDGRQANDPAIEHTVMESYKNSAEVVLNRTLLELFAQFTHADYGNRFGGATITRVDNGCAVVYSNLDAVVYYLNDIDNSSRFDVTFGAPYDNATPSYISLSDMSVIFSGMNGTLTYGELSGLYTEQLTLVQDSELYGDAVTFSSEGCEVIVDSDSQGDVELLADNRIIPPEPGTVTLGDLTLEGRVLDATTGAGVPDATVTIWRGNTSSGESIANFVTDSSGHYIFSGLSVGEYTLAVERDGYIREEIQVSITGQTIVTTRDIIISPELAAGQIRVVLSWGAAPSDVDLHVRGDLDSGNSFHVFYGDPTAYANGTLVADLDVDDVTSYGPETITLYDANGRFEIWIVDYLNTGSLGMSGAVVRVYLPGEAGAIEFNVPSSAENEWNVCVIDHGSVYGY